jgi:cytochrome oxidase Cu insertion factor (SCO1/SenC/PrrC family)
MKNSRERRLQIVAGTILLSGLVLAIGVMAFGPAGRAGRIAARNAAARGGLEAWRAVRSMSMSGELEAGVRRDPVRLAMAYESQILAKTSARRAQGRRDPTAQKPVQLPFTMELRRPRQSRLEVRFRGQTAVQVFDGKEGWKLRPFLGRREVESYDSEELRLAAEQAELDGPLIDYSAKGNRLALLGTEKIEGRDTYKIRVTSANGQVRHVWVDVHNDLEVRIDGSRRLDGKPRSVWTDYRDYRAEGGLMIPHVLETTVEGVAGSEKILIDRVEINPNLGDGRFSKPEALALDGRSPPADDKDKDKKQDQGGAVDPHSAHRDLQAPLERASRSNAEYRIPPVTLLRDDGKSVSLTTELDDGRVSVVNFVFTACTTICPVMSQTFSQLQNRLGSERDKVHMLSISIDPEQDRPARLSEYARKVHAGPGWRHYTGTAEAIVAVQRAFDAYRGDKMNHTPVTFLRAAPGGRWVRIDGFASADELAREVHTLLAGR